MMSSNGTKCFHAQEAANALMSSAMTLAIQAVFPEHCLRHCLIV